mmetsp:Transcript_35108/g.76855  ORF Transcript_35108/g.76855 Transcript_35108/m.76855 type:complete len:319 (-) Transcript_35108:29-985(-)
MGFYACLLLLVGLVQAGEPSKFLLVSAPRLGRVVYYQVNGGKQDGEPSMLIDSGLKVPQGLAVDQKRGVLYVADVDSKKIFSYQLMFNNGQLMTDGQQKVAAQDVEARWVAVDGVGSIFFTDEKKNLVQKVSASSMLRGSTKPETLYSGENVSTVSAPGGVAADNFFVYWTNKAAGTSVGSVISGYETPPDTGTAPSDRAIAMNTVKAYSVCLAQNNAFFTDAQRRVYGVRKTGGAIAVISEQLQSPRGCVWDGDGTVYVADKGAGKVFSFPGSMRTLTPQRMEEVLTFEDAFGLAVVSAVSAPGVIVALAALLFSRQ